VPLIGAVSDNPDPGPEPAGSREAADPCLEPSTRAHSSAPTRNALRRPLPSLGVPLRFSFGCPPVGLATFLQCAPSGSPCGSPSGLRRIDRIHPIEALERHDEAMLARSPQDVGACSGKSSLFFVKSL